MPVTLGAYDQYYLAVAVLVGTYAAALAVIWVAQRSRFSEFIGSFRGVAENFATVINVIFALNLAFIANDTWSAHERALDAVYLEAGHLQNVVDLAVHLPDGPRAKVEAAVTSYARLTVETEWPLLGRRESSAAVSRQLDTLLALLSGASVTASASDNTQAEMLRQAIAVRSTRDRRIALSQNHVNPLKWLGMAFLGAVTIVAIAIVHIDHARAQVLTILLFATAAAPTAAIILIHGNPFQAPMAVSPAPIAAIINTGDA